jgi:cytochrome c peroxidase
LIPKKTILAVGVIFIATAVVAGDTTPTQLLKGFEAQAGTKGSAERGRVLFTSKHTGGKPDTPSCITCHTSNLRGRGETRAGKVIEPMALSANPSRFTDSAKVAKWFRRNCKTVLGRECVAREKADVIAFLMSQ